MVVWEEVDVVGFVVDGNVCCEYVVGLVCG